MNVDEFGLPVQLDRDAADQLQRVGMIAVVEALIGSSKRPPEMLDPVLALMQNLQVLPGLYSRYTHGTTKDVTGDQLVPVISTWVMLDCWSELRLMWRRLFVAQNVRKQGEPDVRTIPDFLLLRTLPLFVRGVANACPCTWLLHPLVVMSDILLIMAAIVYNIAHRAIGDVDDNNLIITLTVCKVKLPTLLSRLACVIYTKFRAPNLGSVLYNVHPVVGALRWYHRAEWPSYGNPEIATMWEQVVVKYLL